MNLKTLKDIPSSFLLAKRALVICLAVSVLTVFGSLAWAYMVTQSFKKSAFVITENGAAAIAKGINLNEVDDYRKPEILNHINMFHDLYFNIDQFSYERKINKALSLIGNSGKELYQTFKAQGYYAKIETQNLEQRFKIDSIKVNDKKAPYKAKIYGKLILNRTDQKSKTVTKMNCSFDVINVARTEKNPHGLLIENYFPKWSKSKKIRKK